MAVAQTALEASAPVPEMAPEPPPSRAEPEAAPSRGHTITIPSGIWDARVTQEFQARIAKLDSVVAPQPAAPRPIKPWIKPYTELVRRSRP